MARAYCYRCESIQDFQPDEIGELSCTKCGLERNSGREIQRKALMKEKRSLLIRIIILPLVEAALLGVLLYLLLQLLPEVAKLRSLMEHVVETTGKVVYSSAIGHTGGRGNQTIYANEINYGSIGQFKAKITTVGLYYPVNLEMSVLYDRSHPESYVLDRRRGDGLIRISFGYNGIASLVAGLIMVTIGILAASIWITLVTTKLKRDRCKTNLFKEQEAKWH